MPVSTRKRKSPATPAGKQVVSGRVQKGIKDFVTVRKSLVGDVLEVKGKRVDGLIEAAGREIQVVDEKELHGVAVQNSQQLIPDKKRKRSLDSPADDEHSDGEKGSVANFFKHFSGSQEPNGRTKRVKNDNTPPSPSGTSSKNAAALFDKLHIQSKPELFALDQNKSAFQTPPDTPDEKIQARIPEELEDLIQLHASFLASLSVYYAHNGTSSPAQVEDILSLTTKNWKRRAVTMEDLRRLLALDQRQADDFTLQDYGRGGVCLTRSQARGRAIKRAASYIDEQELGQRFEQSLRQRWTEWKTNKARVDQDAATFAKTLPLIDIVRNAAVDKAAPLFARGQQRLADIKAGQAAAQTCHAQASSPTVKSEQKSFQAVQNRGMSLLDRILAKQADTAGMPAGPTRDQLERKSALHRIEEIGRVLELLAGTKMRASFSLQILTQHLQQSLRNPISREEVERCLGLMAREITPGFVSVVESGSVKGVVVCRLQKISLEELRARVQKAEQ